MREHRRVVLAARLAAGCLLATALQTAMAQVRLKDLADLSLEQLSNIVVTSVSREETNLSDAATSIFVITAHDIRRAGAVTIPEALRLAPNLQVARIDARNYAVSARGFNSALENKLLVLIDGRSIYSPLFSGVFWDAQDTVIEDIERIEVISGPGATIWGANAVNGIINIMTRSAKNTQGVLASVAGGNMEKTGAARYGGQLANGGHYRIYAKYADANDSFRESGGGTQTGWRRRQAGFRSDWSGQAGTFTFQGDTYTGDLRQTGTADIRIGGANLVGRMQKVLADGSNLRLQAYWDHTERDQPLAFKEKLDTLDLEFQHSFKWGGSHHATWGGGYRRAWDRLENGPAFAFLPASFDMDWANVFAQDEFLLRPDLRLTLGMKFERNPYTGLESLPTARLAWAPDARQLIWSALSRTVRSPSRIDRDFYAPSNPAIVGGVPQYTIGGGPDFSSEVANVAELGYRAQPLPSLSYSATAFVSRYERLRTVEPRPGSSTIFANLAEGTVRGIEMWGAWQPTREWRLSAGWVEQRIRTSLKPGSQDASGLTGIATNDPRRYATLRSSYDINAKTQLDWTLRYVGSLPRPHVPSYYDLNMRLGWKPRPGLELALIGNNLLRASHPEFAAAPNRSVFERSILVQLIYGFN